MLNLMTEHRDRRSEDRDIKELFEAKLEVLDARYKNIGLQNEKLDGKIEKIFETYDSRLRIVESFMHGRDGNKGALLRLQEAEDEVETLNGAVFQSRAGTPGLVEDMNAVKQERRKREHIWALMGGAASGFALWVLTHFGESAWQMVSAHWKPEPPKIAAPQRSHKRAVRYHYHAVPAPQPPPEETPEAPAEQPTEPDQEQRPHAPLNPY